MTQSAILKNRKLIVNDTSVGPSNRQTKTNSPEQFHALIRQTWESRNGHEMADDFRGLIGSYWAIYNGSRGTALTNLSPAGTAPRGGNAFDGQPTGLGFMREQIQEVNDPIVSGHEPLSIVLNHGFLNNSVADAWVELNLAIENWDSSWYAKNGSYFNPLQPSDKYFSENAKVEGIFTGGSSVTFESNANDPNPETTLTTHGVLDKYLRGGPGQVLLDTRVRDHAFVNYELNTNMAIRATSGAGTTVESAYNYYLTTQPPYEETINSTSIPEYLLPNQYLLQAEARNTSTQMYAASNYYALDWGGSLGAFDVDFTLGTHEETGDYYQKVALGLADITPGPSPLLTAMAAYNSNFLILNSDIPIVLAEGNGEYLNTEVIPFYNKIIITPDDHETTGKAPDVSVLRLLKDDPDTSGFIDLLQEYITFNILKGNQKGALDAVVMDTVIRNQQPPLQNSVTNVSYPVYANLALDDADLSSLPNFLFEAGSPVADPELAANRIAAFNYPGGNGLDPQDSTPLPYTLLRNYDPEASSPNGAYTNPAAEAGENVEADFHSLMGGDVWRRYEEILNGVRCHTETLMYLVEKYPLVDGTPASDPVQKFFISNYFGDVTDPADKKTIIYYDSQVKYEQPYRYVIKKVVLVFGNSYQYRDFMFVPQANPAGSKIVFGVDNQLTVRALVVPYAINDSVVTDSPPVAPNLSFYPFKGVNNQVLLLLNGGTGLDSQTPIALLDSDEAKFEANYLSQNPGDPESFGMIVGSTPPKTIDFTSDDPARMYQIFRVSEKPTSYDDFIGQKLTEENIGSDIANGASYIDSILPNTKYYYCARSIDIHGNVSNPTFVYEIELVDNQAQIFMRLNVFIFEAGQLTFVKSGQRFLYIEPALQQVGLESAAVAPGPYDVESPPNTAPILGLESVEKVWNETFKIRLTSKKSGKKMDLNITFKNSGIVNPNSSD